MLARNIRPSSDWSLLCETALDSRVFGYSAVIRTLTDQSNIGPDTLGYGEAVDDCVNLCSDQCRPIRIRKTKRNGNGSSQQ